MMCLYAICEVSEKIKSQRSGSELGTLGFKRTHYTDQKLVVTLALSKRVPRLEN